MKLLHTKSTDLCYAKVKNEVSSNSNYSAITYKFQLRHPNISFFIGLFLFVQSASAYGQTEQPIPSGHDTAIKLSASDLRGQSGWKASGEDVKITREDIHEKRKIVTTIRVVKDGVSVEYHRVTHDWGAVYYFRNGSTSIPENLFVKWTGMQL
jgi:hypothetical protein